MKKNEDAGVSEQHTIGLAVVMMEEIGPETTVNHTDLDEVASMYLAVKGFTAFLTGFERDDYGPGKIRGILQIPSTDYYAVAFDHNMKGLGTEEDSRLRLSRMGIFCLVANNEDLAKIRLYYNETEKFLIEKTQQITELAELSYEFVGELKIEYNNYINQLMKNKGIINTADLQTDSLFDMDILLSLPKEENLTARALIEIITNSDILGASIEDIVKITKRNKRKELKILGKLIEKGLVIIIPTVDEDNKELLYLAK
ncbi:MAG: hypothetical protein ACTSXA_12695 [Candidatus Heimdallarchaeota archaeon]